MGVKVHSGEEKQAIKTTAALMVPQNAVRDNGGQKIVFLVKAITSSAMP